MMCQSWTGNSRPVQRSYYQWEFSWKAFVASEVCVDVVHDDEVVVLVNDA